MRTLLMLIVICLLTACSTVKKQIRKQSEISTKTQVTKKDSAGSVKTDSVSKGSQVLRSSASSVVNNDLKTEETIIEWILVGGDTTFLVGGDLLRESLRNKGAVFIRKTNRLTYDKGSVVSQTNHQAVITDSSSKSSEMRSQVSAAEKTDSTGSRQTMAKDVERKKAFPLWWIPLLLVAIAYFTRRYWRPEIARLLS